MRSNPVVYWLLLSQALVGCIDGGASDEPAVEDAVVPLARPATIQITTEFPPALVVFREGTRGRWQRARRTSATTFEARVRGPYEVSVVCVDHPVFVDLTETLTTQVGRTLEDPHELSFCAGLGPSEHTVTGHMVQPGFVQIGDNNARSSVADWDFTIGVPDGSFDLIASSAGAIGFRRGLTVAGDLAVTPPIDLAQEGTPLADVVFSAPNATPDETTQVSVGLFNPTIPFIPARVFLGPLATAKAAPDAALLPGDLQSASVRAFTDAGGFRALRRPFRVGGDAAYTLPPALAGVQWTIDRGAITLHWAQLPAFTLFSGFVGGNAAGGRLPVDYEVDLSPRFLAATRIHDFTLAADLPGFQPAWTISFDQFYNRDFTVQNVPDVVPAKSVVITSEVTESIDPTAPTQLAAPARPAGTFGGHRGHGAVEP
jgi:hypothetical protein